MPEPECRGAHRARKNVVRTTAFVALSVFVATLVGSASARAWSAAGYRAVGFDAARLAPPDLYRQLVRNRASYALGLRAPLEDARVAERWNAGGDIGRLRANIRTLATQAVQSIEQHRPFNEVAYRLGLLAHYVSVANDPLATGQTDPEERRYAADFDHYLDSARPRIRPVFYGFRPRIGALDDVVAETLARSRGLYPLIGREYRRIAFGRGQTAFDDRSTAYAVAALAYNHAVSDIAEVLRYIWLAAGGTDSRARLPVRSRSGVHLTPGQTAR